MQKNQTDKADIWETPKKFKREATFYHSERVKGFKNTANTWNKREE